MTELELFEAALERSPRDRAPFLDEACAGNELLHQRLEALLARHEKAASFLEVPAPEVLPSPFGRGAGDEGAAATADQTRRERTGIIIAGRYKLLEQIGEGGMGTVWVAEQTEPVKRRVALKLIKPGMDSRQVLSRFEAERQALALMDHPNIAKVFDGGMTDEGRPFFVMEYVKGMPITEYCDHVRLSIADRLKLFVPVCQAVQHAHHKGIIHRDLKPSNILICLYDGQPVPKVIDFGLAKAMHQPLTEHTLYTAHGLMVGTPIYMSPEQAEFNNLDVDTRTDIYSLGVILYELLTGTTPLEQKQIKDAAFQEILRLIKDVEPLKPSTKLTTNARLPAIATQRSLEPAQLRRAVKGDLDWIVMKSLEKERSRRYETPNGLVHDIERFLANEAVQARPPSTIYRLRKVVQRHKAAALATLLVAASLLLGTVISSWLALKATRAEQRAQQNLAKAMDGMRLMLTRLPDSRFDTTLRDEESRLAILDDAATIYEELGRGTDGRRSSNLVLYRHEVAKARLRMARRLAKSGDRTKARATFKNAVAVLERDVAEFPEVPEYRSDAAGAQGQWSRFLVQDEDFAEAERARRRSIELSVGKLTLAVRQLLLASLLQRLNRHQEAEAIFEKVNELASDSSLRNQAPLLAGITHYEHSEWDPCIDAFQRSRQLRNGGDSYEFYYLAMANYQKGANVEALQWYDKGLKNMKKHVDDPFLFSIQEAAEELLQPSLAERSRQP